MAKIVQVLTRPAPDYDLGTAAEMGGFRYGGIASL